MTLDPFAALGIEPSFGLDVAALEQRHRDLSRALHPDRYSSSGAAERRLALSRAIEVNEAFRLLRDPIRRAEALLVRRGVATGEGKEPPASPDLLMEVMERREALADIRHTRDTAALDRLISEVRQIEQRTQSALGLQFASSAPDFAQILKQLGELRYYRRFLDEAATVADDLL